MDRIMGVATGVAVSAMAKKHGANIRNGSFGDTLIAEQGVAAALGVRWNKGRALVTEGQALAGWFVGRAQNRRARGMITRGLAMMRGAERDYRSIAKTKTPDPHPT